MNQVATPSTSLPVSPPLPEPAAPARPATRLYVHSKRERWGLAVMLWEREGKRAYQFEDGKRRIFKEGFYHLFIPRMAPAEPSPEILALLARANAASEDQLTLHQQLAYFESKFPGGFVGEAWRENQRAREGKKALKRHRDPVISAVKSVLSKAELASLIMAGSHEEVLGRVVEVLKTTDLVPAKTVKKLAKIKPSATFSRALMAYLHGPRDEEAAALSGWLSALRTSGIQPGWPMATALRALMHPGRHAAIKPSVLKPQLEVMGKSVFPNKKPSAPSYAHACNALIELDGMLRDLGQEPADLLDVYDFVWTTLRPAARREYAM